MRNQKLVDWITATKENDGMSTMKKPKQKQLQTRLALELEWWYCCRATFVVLKWIDDDISTDTRVLACLPSSFMGNLTLNTLTWTNEIQSSLYTCIWIDFIVAQFILLNKLKVCIDG